MYLKRLEIENFRIFGSREKNEHGVVDFQPGLSLLVGENDSGKTCVIDAIRLLVGTVTQDYFSVQESDFHVLMQEAPGSDTSSEQEVTETASRISDGAFQRLLERSQTLTILGEFRGLNSVEAGALLEYLCVEGTGYKSEFFLRMWLKAEIDDREVISARRRRIAYEVRAGADERGKRVEGPAREFLRATYLKPLRDAAGEMTARKGSRLSQVLRAYPGIKDQGKDDWNPDDAGSAPTTLVGIMRKTESDLKKVGVIKNATKDVNEKYLERFSIGEAPLRGDIKLIPHGLQQILERMELSVEGIVEGATRGLGISNLAFIATELLALAPANDWDPELPLLLLEEPEAHLEPQRQLLLVEFLREVSKDRADSPQNQLQVVLTSHSPNLASKVGVKGLIVMHKGKAFPMGHNTRLHESDYEFLDRFLDVTKSNMFFAKGVLIVEGDAEALLLPTFARKIGRPLTKYGVSIVKVGHTGLFRYSRIFQRKTDPQMAVRVACLRDRDTPPLEAQSLVPDRKTDWTPEETVDRVNSLKVEECLPVIVEVSTCWTLEFDLALTDLAPYLHVAISLAKPAKPTDATLPIGDDAKKIIRSANAEYRRWTEEGKSKLEIACLIYEPLLKRQASKADAAQCLASLLERRHCRPNWDELQWRAVLPEYIVKAMDHATGRELATDGASADETTFDQ